MFGIKIEPTIWNYQVLLCFAFPFNTWTSYWNKESFSPKENLPEQDEFGRINVLVTAGIFSDFQNTVWDQAQKEILIKR